MRPEQVERLAKIEEDLVDIFTTECEPKKWPGMASVQERGDRYWHKKNALATLQLVGRIQTVLRDARPDSGAGEAPKGDLRPDGEGRDPDEIEREAAALEKKGVAILKRHAKKGS